MENYKYLLPEEAGEMSLQNVELLRRLERQLRGLFKNHAYQEVMPPTFEYVELYDKLGTEFKQEKMFQLINHEGKSIALRYDFTIPLTRTYALSGVATPARFSYFGKVYRKEKRYKGRQTEYFQIGTELFGGEELATDRESLNLAQAVVQQLRLKNVVLELGSASFYKRLCALVGDQAGRLRKILLRKDLSSMQEFVNEQPYDKAFKDLLLNILVVDDLAALKVLVLATNDNELLEAFRILILTYEGLADKSMVVFDLGMVPAMSYYTGLMFKVYSAAVAQPIISGGRYDDLLKKFQKDTGAIGFCCHMDNVLKTISSEEEEFLDEE